MNAKEIAYGETVSRKQREFIYWFFGGFLIAWYLLWIFISDGWLTVMMILPAHWIATGLLIRWLWKPLLRRITWRCDVCAAVRPDAKISVHQRQGTLLDVDVEQNVKYCNDRAPCVEGAKDVNGFPRTWSP